MHTRHDQSIKPTRRSWRRRRRHIVVASAALALAGGRRRRDRTERPGGGAVPGRQPRRQRQQRRQPDLGPGRPAYSRVAPARYADGIGAPVAGPERPLRQQPDLQRQQPEPVLRAPRHPVGLRLGPVPRPHLRAAPGDRRHRRPGATSRSTPTDPLEDVHQQPRASSRSPGRRRRAGTGRARNAAPAGQHRQLATSTPSPSTAATNTRLDWLRDGSVDGNPANNSATPAAAQQLPAAARPPAATPATAPAMDVDGRLRANPNRAVVAGDVRANENIAPDRHPHPVRPRAQPDRRRCCRARCRRRTSSRSPGGSSSPSSSTSPTTSSCRRWAWRCRAYTGYKTNVNATLGNEFATVGYRAHSQIHGEFEIETDAGRYTPGARWTPSRRRASRSPIDGDEVELAIPLNVGVLQPRPARSSSSSARCCRASASSRSTRTTSRSTTSCAACCSRSRSPATRSASTARPCRSASTAWSTWARSTSSAAATTACRATTSCARRYGLPAKTSFTSITGESTDQFPAGYAAINNPNSLDFMPLLDIDGNPIDLADEDAVEGTATSGVRRTTVAARLRAIYGNVNNVDAFTGMVAERARARHRVRRAAAGDLDASSSPRCATATGSSTATTRA